ncbi:hypothetical protein VUR80DRAFT_10198 [Thermomyces stellatus]
MPLNHDLTPFLFSLCSPRIHPRLDVDSPGRGDLEDVPSAKNASVTRFQQGAQIARRVHVGRRGEPLGVHLIIKTSASRSSHPTDAVHTAPIAPRSRSTSGLGTFDERVTTVMPIGLPSSSRAAVALAGSAPAIRVCAGRVRAQEPCFRGVGPVALHRMLYSERVGGE